MDNFPISKLIQAIKENGSTQEYEMEIASNLKNAVINPLFFKLDLKTIRRLIMKSEDIDIQTHKLIIQNIANNLEDEGFLILKNIKCINNENDIIDLLEALNSMPIMRETKDLIIKLKEENVELKSRFDDIEDGSMEVNWEAEFKEMENKGRILEKEIQQIKDREKKYNQIIDGLVYKDLEKSNKDQKEIVKAINSNDTKRAFKMIAEDPSLIYARDSNKDTLLFLCAKNEWVKGIEKLLEVSDSPLKYIDMKGPNNCTPLMYSCGKGNLEIIDLLISKGADVNSRDIDGLTPLIYACRGGNVEAVEHILSHGAFIEACDNERQTPLIIASKFGFLEIVGVLLSNGALVDSKDGEGMTALHWACKNNHARVVELLISNGSFVEAKTNNGFTPIFFALKNANMQIAGLLYSNGGNIKFSDAMRSQFNPTNPIFGGVVSFLKSLRKD